MPATQCYGLDRIRLKFSSEKCMFSILGNTLWASVSITVAFPKECGKSESLQHVCNKKIRYNSGSFQLHMVTWFRGWRRAYLLTLHRDLLGSSKTIYPVTYIWRPYPNRFKCFINTSRLHLVSIVSVLPKNYAVKQLGSPAVLSIMSEGQCIVLVYI